MTAARAWFNKADMSPARPIAAALSILAAMLLIGFIDNFVVNIAEDAGLWQFHLTRSVMAVPLIVALAWLGIGTLRVARWWAVAARSLAISAAMVLYFGSLAFLPISEAVAGLFTAPLFVLLVSTLALRERVGAVRILAALVGFAGVVMVLRPDAGAVTLATLAPVGAGFLYALGAIATRRWCATESATALLAAFFTALGIWGALGVAVLAAFPAAGEAPGFILRGWEAPTPAFLGWTVMQAVGSIIAVGLITRSYQMADTAFVSVFEYSLLVFVAVWAWVLRGETVDSWAMLGIGLIIGSGCVLALRGRVAPEAQGDGAVS
ncbi:MAG: DMT family transporter [Pseudomonadota bacterium]